jgi:hypothetical protein
MNKSKNHIQYGLATGGVFILIQVISLVADIKGFGKLSVAVVAALIFVGVFLSSKAMQRKIPEVDSRSLFFNGLRTTALAALVVVLFGVLLLKLFPQFKNKQIDQYRSESTAYMSNLHSTMRKDSAEKYKIDTTTLALVNKKLDSTIVADKNGLESYITNYDNNFTKIFVMFNLLNIVLAGLIASIVASYLLKKR